MRQLAGALAAALMLTCAPGIGFAQKAAARERAPVTLNFVNADIEAVARAMGMIVERQIVVDPRVKGTITLYSEQPMSTREAFLNFMSALRGLGFAVVDTAGMLKIVPEAEAKLQTGTVSIDAVTRRGDQVITQIFRLNHESVNNLVPVLRPLISPNNTINANPGSNTLVITDYADNLKRLAQVIATLDVPAATGVEVIPLKHAVASDIAPLVQRLSDSRGGGPVTPAAAAAGSQSVTVLVDPRSNALIVRAANPSKLAMIRALVDQLDQPAAGVGPAGNIWVVYLKNADAVKLAAVLRAAYGAGAGAASTTTSPTRASTSTGAAAAGQTSTAATTPVAASLEPSTGGFIQADPATNSLIITAPEPMYRQLRAVIDQLDSRRAQIYVESMIVEMDAQKAAEFGFQWQGLLGNKGDRNLLAAGTNFGSGGNNIVNLSIGGPSGTVTPGAGLNIGLVRQFGGIYTLASLARFLETNTDANILSTPNLVALDNEEAKIVIGQNVPFITGQYTAANTGTGNVNPFQTIERKDVGLTLRVRPQIGESGTVRMTIFQENSSVVANQSGTTSSAGPTTNKSSIETTVTVDDGQIMVLGGLLKDEFTNNRDQVPGLGSVPILGHLFRSESRARRKTNLMVFLRPVVMRTPQAVDSLTLDRYESIRARQQDAQPQPSVVVPINDAPVLPPLPAPAASMPAASPRAAPPPTAATPPVATPSPVPQPASAPASGAATN